ncbi:MAG: class I SAM-dependent methyltransferase [Magnetospirillum sp.]|nr:class I SAM-dependent methyltransferase [Magnetospirillum sp.]
MADCEIYRRARDYDIACRRDVGREVDFLGALYERHSGRPLSSVLDLGCGPGYHARLFARRGIPAVGLDRQAEMVAFARDQAVADGVTVQWMAADMRAFMLDRPVDLIFTGDDGIDSLITQDDIVGHFRTVARNLTPRGLYVFELTHPRDCSLWNYAPFLYRGERDGVRVEIAWGTEPPSVDPATQVAAVEVTMRVSDGGVEDVIRHRSHERFAGAQEYVALAQLSTALDSVGFFGDFQLGQPFDASPAARRMIAVFAKK